MLRTGKDYRVLGRHLAGVGQLARLWRIWQPQAESYVRRALRPAQTGTMSSS